MHSAHRIILVLIVGTALGMGITPVRAARFDINPVRLGLDKSRTMAAVTVSNRSNDATVVQVSVLRWQQENGKDSYTPTKDLLVNPPIFTIPPGQSQILRIGLNRPVDSTHELAYRLYLQEVPPPQKPGLNGLRMVLRIGLPIFVLPERPAKAVLQWQVSRAQDKTLVVNVANNGNAHTQIIDFRLVTPDAHANTIAAFPAHIYLFPGQSSRWLLTPARDWTDRRAKLRVLTDEGAMESDVALN